MAVYGQPKMMEKWFETIRQYDDKVRDRLAMVVVDDHGTPPQTLPQWLRVMFDCRLYRVDRQIHWNQMGARNLGVREAPTPWVVLLDPDMVIELGVARKLLMATMRMTPGQVLKPNLRYTNNKMDGSSPNVYVIHKADFDRVGGYDEDYAGNKGWSDVQFLHTLTAAHLQIIKRRDVWVRYYRPRDISDATVKTLNRDVQANKALHLRKMALLKKLGVQKFIKMRKPNVRFPWSRLH